MIQAGLIADEVVRQLDAGSDYFSRCERDEKGRCVGETCYACGKKLGKSHAHARVTGEEPDENNRYCVGSECDKLIRKAGEKGYQPPKGGPRLSPHEEGAKKPKTIKADIFYRTWNRDTEKMASQASVRSVRIEVPEDADLDAIAKLAYAAGASVGAKGQSGIFEIQTDRGIWARPDGKPLLPGGKPHRHTSFKSWDELEKEG